MFRKKMYDSRVDTILPWICFTLLAVIGIWMITKNGQWWNTVVSIDFLPNPTLYYVIWIVFLILFPFAYTMLLSSCATQATRTFVHVAMILLTAFLLLWVIFVYHRRDFRTGLIFMGISWFIVLVAVITSFTLHSSATGLLFLFFLWLTLVWFLVSSARAEGINSMYDTLRRRFMVNHADSPTSSILQ